MIKLDQDAENESGDLIGLRQALPIGELPKNFDPTIPPTSGEEFILHVLHESKNFGSFFTAANKIDESVRNIRGGKIPAKAAIILSDNGPSIEWRCEQVNIFSKLRSRMLKLRLQQPKPSSEVIEIVRKYLKPFLEETDAQWMKFLCDNEPRLTVLFALRQELLERALRCFTNECISLEQGAWVYAIAANLDHPLSREACADLRDIARKCAQIRDNNEKEKTAEQMNMLNLIITIVVEYFQQRDLCED